MFFGGIFNSLTPGVKPLVIQSLATFDSTDRTPKCGPFIGKLLSSNLFLCCLFFTFGKCINIGIGTVSTEKVNVVLI